MEPQGRLKTALGVPHHQIPLDNTFGVWGRAPMSDSIREKLALAQFKAVKAKKQKANKKAT